MVPETKQKNRSFTNATMMQPINRQSQILKQTDKKNQSFNKMLKIFFFVKLKKVKKKKIQFPTNTHRGKNCNRGFTLAAM